MRFGTEAPVFAAIRDALAPLTPYGFDFHPAGDSVQVHVAGRLAFIPARVLIDAEDACAVVAEAFGL